MAESQKQVTCGVPNDLAMDCHLNIPTLASVVLYLMGLNSLLCDCGSNSGFFLTMPSYLMDKQSKAS